MSPNQHLIRSFWTKFFQPGVWYLKQKELVKFSLEPGYTWTMSAPCQLIYKSFIRASDIREAQRLTISSFLTGNLSWDDHPKLLRPATIWCATAVGKKATEEKIASGQKKDNASP
ncbi:hypothetical protein O181_021975 [Austropuccinia psidii MF-1]|uniref:Uncharacterized protein n=1 Tax=Austropuccinia psidii MF-1 TaxID=1389203 RepID=A0A9Q3GXM1_9BASI|nr:hypothetical protein [Austropuccinia psidii MF-1]